jgi:hypothetical protein
LNGQAVDIDERRKAIGPGVDRRIAGARASCLQGWPVGVAERHEHDDRVGRRDL